MNRENEIHTRPQALLFLAKVSLFQLKRTAENFFDSEIKTFHSGDNLKDKPTVAESKTPLWTKSEPEEQWLLAGKVHNLRLAVKRLNRLEIPLRLISCKTYAHKKEANAMVELFYEVKK